VQDAGKPRIVVAGGGIIGCSIARELSGCGCRVVLVERDRIGAEASAASAGILCPQVEAEAPSPLLDLGMESLRLYPGFVERVRKETGIDPELDTPGSLLLDLTREDEQASQAQRAWQAEARLPVERVGPDDLAGLEPGLGQAIRGGLYFPGSARVDPRALTRGVAMAARARSAEIREGAPVAGLQRAGDKVTGVVLAGGEILEADEVVLASGAWSSAFLPETAPAIVPIRGQMIVFDAPRPPRAHVLISRHAYLVPRRDGTVLVGSTTENAGFRKEVTPKALLRLTAAALAIDPSLSAASFATAWSGLRPAAADGLPVLGRVGPGLVAATGHYRNGILLAPITAALVTELILRGAAGRPLDPFSPGRRPPSPGVLPDRC
jgi:glycine oxidase